MIGALAEVWIVAIILRLGCTPTIIFSRRHYRNDMGLSQRLPSWAVIRGPLAMRTERPLLLAQRWRQS